MANPNQSQGSGRGLMDQSFALDSTGSSVGSTGSQRNMTGNGLNSTSHSDRGLMDQSMGLNSTGSSVGSQRMFVGPQSAASSPMANQNGSLNSSRQGIMDQSMGISLNSTGSSMGSPGSQRMMTGPRSTASSPMANQNGTLNSSGQSGQGIMNQSMGISLNSTGSSMGSPGSQRVVTGPRSTASSPLANQNGTQNSSGLSGQGIMDQSMGISLNSTGSSMSSPISQRMVTGPRSVASSPLANQSRLPTPSSRNGTLGTSGQSGIMDQSMPFNSTGSSLGSQRSGASGRSPLGMAGASPGGLSNRSVPLERSANGSSFEDEQRRLAQESFDLNFGGSNVSGQSTGSSFEAQQRRLAEESFNRNFGPNSTGSNFSGPNSSGQSTESSFEEQQRRLAQESFVNNYGSMYSNWENSGQESIYQIRPPCDPNSPEASMSSYLNSLNGSGGQQSPSAFLGLLNEMANRTVPAGPLVLKEGDGTLRLNRTVGDIPRGNYFIDSELARVQREMDRVRQGNNNLNSAINSSINSSMNSTVDSQRGRSRSRLSPGGRNLGGPLTNRLLEDMYKIIVGQLDELRKAILQRGLGRAVEANITRELNDAISFELVGLSTVATANYVRFIMTQLGPFISESLVTTYGPRLADVMAGLRAGTLECSRPCHCGTAPEPPKVDRASDPHPNRSGRSRSRPRKGGNYPRDCKKNCPCKLEQSSVASEN